MRFKGRGTKLTVSAVSAAQSSSVLCPIRDSTRHQPLDSTGAGSDLKLISSKHTFKPFRTGEPSLNLKQTNKQNQPKTPPKYPKTVTKYNQTFLSIYMDSFECFSVVLEAAEHCPIVLPLTQIRSLHFSTPTKLSKLALRLLPHKSTMLVETLIIKMSWHLKKKTKTCYPESMFSFRISLCCSRPREQTGPCSPSLATNCLNTLYHSLLLS